MNASKKDVQSRAMPMSALDENAIYAVVSRPTEREALARILAQAQTRTLERREWHARLLARDIAYRRSRPHETDAGIERLLASEFGVTVEFVRLGLLECALIALLEDECSS